MTTRTARSAVAESQILAWKAGWRKDMPNMKVSCAMCLVYFTILKVFILKKNNEVWFHDFWSFSLPTTITNRFPSLTASNRGQRNVAFTAFLVLSKDPKIVPMDASRNLWMHWCIKMTLFLKHKIHWTKLLGPFLKKRKLQKHIPNTKKQQVDRRVCFGFGFGPEGVNSKSPWP